MTVLEDWDPVAVTASGLLVYPDAAAWVEQWWVHIIGRRTSMPWCPQWWAHPEAAARLGALWAAWETANAEGGAAMSQWWVYHCDGHLATLTDSRGPFAACSNGHRDVGPACPTAPAQLALNQAGPIVMGPGMEVHDGLRP